MILKSLILFLILFISAISVNGQIGGKYAFESVSLPLNARLTALGGYLPSVIDDDIAMAFQNPALSNSQMDMQFSLNHNFHFAGISNGNVLFGKTIDSLGVSLHGGISYVNYGTFTATDELGQSNGEFKAREVGLLLGAARQLNERIRLGINLKFLNAAYESYGSFALGADLGLFYSKPGSRATWAIVLKNIGTELDPLVDNGKALPFDLQLGFSNRLAHLPFRFSIVARQLQQWYIRYDDPDRDIQTNFLGEEQRISGFSKAFDNLFRHLVFNGEFLIGRQEQFRVRFGYNHLRKQEMRLQNFRSLAGFSFGLGFNIRKIRIDYGVGYYHLAGAANHLSIRLNMGQIFNKI